MVRKVIAGLVLVLLVYLGWTWYKGRTEKARLDSGDVTCQGCLEGEAKARFLKENAGETRDGNSERKAAPAAVAAEQATAGTGAAGTAAAPRNGTVTPVIVPPVNTEVATMAAPQDTNAGSRTTQRQATPPSATNVAESYSGRYSGSLGYPPATDSVAANPQNDLHFRGAGSFEWYRQGNITWRVDTTTGHSCIVYATMDEWRKQIVLSHGCGRTT